VGFPQISNATTYQLKGGASDERSDFNQIKMHYSSFHKIRSVLFKVGMLKEQIQHKL